MFTKLKAFSSSHTHIRTACSLGYLMKLYQTLHFNLHKSTHGLDSNGSCKAKNTSFRRVSLMQSTRPILVHIQGEDIGLLPA